ncbi:MAG: M48 family metallopeptidase [Cyanobacteria bacterium]|nr:M48 family metallopeptidase [Cyanobacteriota bacterium]
MGDKTFKNESQIGRTTRRHLSGDRDTFEMYQAFMDGYVRRINQSTFNVTFGGIRIGSAKYSRLAQINLKSRIITFSRYAIENVPERGRRYLVLHELAHVLEPSHNGRFWQLVGRYEANYKQISKQLDLAFKRNVREEQLNRSSLQLPNPITGNLERPKLLLANPLMNHKPAETLRFDGSEHSQIDESVLVIEDDLECFEDFDEDCSHLGTLSGGSLISHTVVTTA